MSLRWLTFVGALLAFSILVSGGGAVLRTDALLMAAPDKKAPRIVRAAMLDVDGDSRGDRVRLTYSERIRHAADRDGRYPFRVVGYRIRSVGVARGKSLVILVVEKAKSDRAAMPAIRYRRTRSRPVRDRAGNQAVAQVFRATKAHGHAPAPPSPPPAPRADADGDGTADGEDCAPTDSEIHPGAADRPDLSFVDSNCDGIDGTEAAAIFASPSGDDANPGTKAKPKRQIQAAVTAAAGNDRYVLVAFGTYGHVTAASGVSIYGGYDPVGWARRDRYPDGEPLIVGSPEGMLAAGATNVVLQHLAVRGLNAGVLRAIDQNVYGIRAISGASLMLQRVVASAGAGVAGGAGADGAAGPNGGNGESRETGSCDGVGGGAGVGGSSPAERPGGAGGRGGIRGTFAATPGQEGQIGTPGGAAGKDGNPGSTGGKGQSGENGVPGSRGAGGTSSVVGAAAVWAGQRGGAGGVGNPGNGGGGGGGGGAQTGAFVIDGTGNGGGGGGGGGSGGLGGGGGLAGSGSFGVYLYNSTLVVQASSIVAGNGGGGGPGGDGGFGGAGGTGGKGGTVCTSEVGAGGDGGFGGAGGRGGGGGGGAGGPSIGIFRVGTSAATFTGGSTVAFGIAGPGGAGAGAAGSPGLAQANYP